MDGTLRSFLLNYNPEYTFCYPWERCLDPEVDLIYYRNVRDATLIVDLRTRVNLGGGLYHFNDIWNDLVNDKDCDYYTFFYRRETNGDDHHNLIFISATCCGSSIYFLVPEIVLRCPICDSFVHRWDIIRVVMV
ncbi:hypothetical protein WN943_009357 [Citrus x changshan-huyou]